MYLTVWYVNTYTQFSDVLFIHIPNFHKPPSGVGSVMNEGVRSDASSDSTRLNSDNEDDVDVSGVEEHLTLAQLVEDDFTLSQVELMKYSDKTLSQIEELRDAKRAGKIDSPAGESLDNQSLDDSGAQELSNRPENLPKNTTEDMLAALGSISESGTSAPTDVV